MKIKAILNKDVEHNCSKSLASKLISGSRISSAVLASLLLVGVSATAEANKHKCTKKHHHCKHHKHHRHHKCHGHNHQHKQENFVPLWDGKNKTFTFGTWKFTPGGYVAGNIFWRQHGTQTDVNSSWNAIPFPNNQLYYINELRLTARNSHLTFKAEGDYNPSIHITGFWDMDWLGNNLGNSNSTNSFGNRIYQIWANVDWNDTGWHFLAGQSWSLITADKKGIIPLNEVIPITLDATYLPGFTYKRQPQLRLVKNWGPNWWAALSVENAQQVNGGTSCFVGASPNPTAPWDGVSSVFCSATGGSSLPSFDNFGSGVAAGGVLANPVNNQFSLNQAPDVVGKLAWDSNFDGRNFHVEGFGLYRVFTDRVGYNVNGVANATFSTLNTSSWSGGVSAFLEAMPQFLDLNASVTWGDSVGSYAAGGLPDATLGFDGSLQPIKETAWYVGGILHANPAIDLFVYGGQEIQESNFFANGLVAAGSNPYYGIGFPTYNNTGCNVELGTCQGQTRNLWQVTGGIWDTVYDGWVGQLKLGLQYSYTKRELWGGTGTGAGAAFLPAGGPSLAPSTDQSIVLGSVRYYPFTVPKAKAFVK